MTQDHTLREQVFSGFRLTGKVLLVFAWFVAAVAAVSTVTDPRVDLLAGWILLAAVALIFVATAQRWIKILPGVLAYGVIGGSLVAFSGHALNQPNVPVSLSDAIVMIVFAASTATITSTFVRRKLTWLDRLFLLGFVGCLFWAGAKGQDILAPLSAALVFLLIGWGCDRAFHKRT